MGRFNTATVPRSGTTLNRANSEAFEETPRLALASLVLTSLVQDQFYRKADETLTEMRTLVDADPEFAAKCAVFARNEYGMRSISHAVAGEIGKHSAPWKRDFYRRVVRRPDDVLEILAYYKSHYGKKLPSAMKRGLADALIAFDPYQLAKYRGEGRGIKLVDAANLLHPKPTEATREAWKALIAGTLVSTETWETKLSKAGKDGEAKETAWRTLLSERKLGYMALLKNLRNILQQAPELVPLACEQLTDEQTIRRSLVFPFRFVTAAKELSGQPGAGPVLLALSRAADISLANVPVLPGRTCVILDDSGSMHMAADKSARTAFELGAPFAVALVNRMNADLMLFSNDARYLTLTPFIGIFDGVSILRANSNPQGTDFRAPFNRMLKPYDRLIFLSDMQGWVGGQAPTAELAAYNAKHDVNAAVFSFDLTGYGSLQFPQDKVYAMAGFSDRVFDVMATLEQDRDALVHRIEAIDLAS